MKASPPAALAEGTGPLPLRSNFAWTLGGNVIYGVSQWAILSLIAKLGSSEMLGQYALAVAIASPIVMLSHLNLRAVLATDIEEHHPFGDYLAVRLGSSGVALLATAIIALVSRYPQPVGAVMVLAGVSLSVENISDIYYGLFQRSERMDRVARSMILRGILSVLALGAALSLTRDLAAAVAATALVRVVLLLAYDRPRSSAGTGLRRSGIRAQLRVFRTALPLGVVLMLVSLTSNLPRYAIERFLGTRQLGAFAAVAVLLGAGATVIHALGQSAMPRLARHLRERDRKSFRRLALKLLGLAVLIGLAGVVFAALLGGIALTVVYRSEYAAYRGVFTAVMGAGVLSYVAIVLGYLITSARSFMPQMPLLCTVAATSAAASWVLVPAFGLQGAAMALGLAACVQIAGEALILRRAWNDLEPAA